MKKYDLTDYWLKHYTPKEACSLCANHGTIDTTGLKTPAGIDVGCLNFCICPNGQFLRKQSEVDA